MELPNLPVYLVDAFSSGGIGKGNPAAVCLLPAAALPLPDSMRQTIAAEMNQSETAFVEPLGESGANTDREDYGSPEEEDAATRPGIGLDAFTSSDTYGLRWFTPTVEMPLCGHATLASAAVLFQELGNTASKLNFKTLSGVLTVKRLPITPTTSASPDSPQPQLLEMSLPWAAPDSPLPPCLAPSSESRMVALAAATGHLPVADVLFAGQDIKYVLVVLQSGTSQAQLEAVQPDLEALKAAAPREQVHGFIVTAQGEPSSPYDFVSRFFAPQVGIPEDSVTGSAHCVLGPYWAQALGDKHHLHARQCSPRGGDVHARLEAAVPGSNSPGRVHVSGPAAIVMKGTLAL